MNAQRLMTIFLILVAALLLTPLAASAAEDKPAAKPAPAIELGAPFADNAILQREMPVPVWGWSKPGTKVTVEFAGQKETAKAGTDGKWMLKLKPLKASAEPAEMVISDSDGKKVVLKNVLVGEVWMASGQSNMQWKAGQVRCGSAPEAHRRVGQGRQREAAGHPRVRGDQRVFRAAPDRARHGRVEEWRHGELQRHRHGLRL